MCGFFRDSRTNSESFGDKVALATGIMAGIGISMAFTFGLSIPAGLLSIGFYVAVTLLTEKIIAPIAAYAYRKCKTKPLVEQENKSNSENKPEFSESDVCCPTFN